MFDKKAKQLGMKHKLISKKDRQDLAELNVILSKHPGLISHMKETAVIAQNEAKVLGRNGNKKKHDASKKPKKKQAEELAEKNAGICKIHSLPNNVLEVSIQVDLTGSMMEIESKIQEGCNTVGNVVT